MAITFRELIDNLKDQAPELAESVEKLGLEISYRVIDLRNAKRRIEQLRVSSGILAEEEHIAVRRDELMPLAQSYREQTDTNWADDTGYCRHAQVGESHSYPVKKVDEALAHTIGALGELAEMLIPTPENQRPVNAKALLDDPDVTLGEVIEALKRLAEYAEQQEAVRRQTSLMIEDQQRALQILAASRKTRQIKEKVQIK